MFSTAQIDSLRVGVDTSVWQPPEQDQMIAAKAINWAPTGLSFENLAEVGDDIAACFDSRRYANGLIMPIPPGYDITHAASFGLARLVRDESTTTVNAEPDEALDGKLQSQRVFAEVLRDIDTTPFYSGRDAYRVKELNGNRETRFQRSVLYALPIGSGLLALAGNQLRQSRVFPVQLDPETLIPGQTFNISHPGRNEITRTRIVKAHIIIPKSSA